jgi:hypothetical protein
MGQLKAITPQQYGAVGNGSADDTAAVQAWFTALKTGNYLGYCNGVFRLTGSVNASPTKSYRVEGSFAAVSSTSGTGCKFYVDYNNWASAAIDLTTPSNPTTSNRGRETWWSNVSIIYNPALTAPPVGFRHRYSSALNLENFSILQYTVNRGTCLSISSAFNDRLKDNVQIWGCGGNVPAHLRPAGITFSITAAATTLTSSATFFSAADVGQDIVILGSPLYEAFHIASFTNTTTVEVTRAATNTHTAQLGAVSAITGAMTAGSPTLTINVANLSSSDVGRNVYVLGCGSTDGTSIGALRSTISAVSGATVTLADNALTNCAAGASIIIGPAVEIYADADGTINNDVSLIGLHEEQNSGTALVVANAVNLRGTMLKLHSWNNANIGETAYESQFNGVFVRTDLELGQADIEGTSITTLGQILLQGINAGGNTIGMLDGFAITGQPKVAISNIAANNGVTVGTINTPHQLASTWVPSLVTSDGTGRGLLAQGAVTTQLTPAQLPKLIATTTNDNACDGCVGQMISNGSGSETATVTFTAATPSVITWTSHELSQSNPSILYFTSTMAVPTGFTADTNYWTVPGTITNNTFSVAPTLADALAGTNLVAASDTGTGVQTGTRLGYLPDNTPLSILAVTLPAGDWDCWGGARFLPAASTTQSFNGVGIAPTIDYLGTVDQSNGTMETYTAYAAGKAVQYPTGLSWRRLATQTVVYLTAQADFAVDVERVAGRIDCRRAR